MLQKHNNHLSQTLSCRRKMDNYLKHRKMITRLIILSVFISTIHTKSTSVQNNVRSEIGDASYFDPKELPMVLQAYTRDQLMEENRNSPVDSQIEKPRDNGIKELPVKTSKKIQKRNAGQEQTFLTGEALMEHHHRVKRQTVSLVSTPTYDDAFKTRLLDYHNAMRREEDNVSNMLKVVSIHLNFINMYVFNHRITKLLISSCFPNSCYSTYVVVPNYN